MTSMYVPIFRHQKRNRISARSKTLKLWVFNREAKIWPWVPREQPNAVVLLLLFSFFLIKIRSFSLLTIKVHAIRSAKFTYLELSKSQGRNNIIIFNKIKRKYNKLQTSWGTSHTLCGFFTLPSPLALPEDLYHYAKFSVQNEIVAKNALSFISHNVISSKELGAWRLSQIRWLYRFIT